MTEKKESTLQNRRLLILGTQFELSGLVRKAKARGCYTVVCDAYPEGPARYYADRAYLHDIREIDVIADLCKTEQIDAIITSFSDIMFECMVKIAARAGLPCYLAPEQLEVYRRKEQMKDLCRKMGIAVPDWVVLHKDTRAEELSALSFPCVVKPLDSYGSRGIKVVYSPREALEAFGEVQSYSSTPQALVEELSRGQELNCMSFVVDGKVHVLSIADRMTAFWRRDHIPVNYAIRYPSSVLDETAELVRDVLQRFAEGTGQTFGPLSMQCFYHQGSIEVCEIAGRFFGFEHEMVEYYSGLDLETLLLDTVLAPQKAAEMVRRHCLTGKRWADCIYMQGVKEGIVADQRTLYQLAADPMVRMYVPFYRTGEFSGVLGPRQYFARYYLVSDTREAMLAKEREIFQSASALDEAGQELLFVPSEGKEGPGAT